MLPVNQAIISSESLQSADTPHTNRRLTLFFFVLLIVSTALRVLLSVFPKFAVTYDDELFYLEIAQNIWLRGSVSVYAAPIRFTKILYALLLSPFYAISDGMLRNSLISGFNALLISSSLIPGWLLARRILKKDSHIILAMLFLALSPNLLFSLTFMAENLYYPLLMWSFLALYCALTKEKKSPRSALLLGFLAFLLYMTKEVGAAFLFSLAALCVASRSWSSLLFSLAGFACPYLIIRVAVFGSLGYTYADQLALPDAPASIQVTYLLYGCLITSLFFLLSGLWFPIAIPLSERRKLTPPNRQLFSFILLYAAAVTIGIAFGILLNDDSITITPRIHLRYFLGVLFPMLLLFLVSSDSDNHFRFKSFLFIGTIVFSAVILLFFFLPSRGSLVDHPALHLLGPLQNATDDLPLWLCRCFFPVMASLFLFFWYRRRHVVSLSVLFVLLFASELVSGYTFVNSAVLEERIHDEAYLSEVRRLDEEMDRLNGNILLILPDLYADNQKLLNTISDNDYAVVLKKDLMKYYESDDPGSPEGLSVDPASVAIPFPRFMISPCYELPTFDYVITTEEWEKLDWEKNEEITPEGLTSFHVYQSSDPSGLNLVPPMSYIPGDQILFYGEKPSFHNYRPTGFSGTETGWTWSEGNETSITLRPRLPEPQDLIVTWTWAMTNGPQLCEIYANDTLIRFETLSNAEKELIFYVPADCYAETGLINLRFVFPEAKEPGNGDPRILAVAFSSLILEAE